MSKISIYSADESTNIHKSIKIAVDVAFIVCFAVAASIGTGTMIKEHNMYKENYYWDQYNFASIQRARDEEKPVVYCFKNNNNYRNAQPYDDVNNTERINTWIKNYFGCDPNMRIEWIDDYGFRHADIYPATDDLRTTSFISGIYGYEPGIDGWWTSRNFSLSITKVDQLIFFNPFGANSMSVIVNGYYYTTIEIQGYGFYGVAFNEEVLCKENNHIIFLLSQSQGPTNLDKRELGLILKPNK